MDDTTLTNMGFGWGGIKNRMYMALKLFASLVKINMLKLSEKATIVASNQTCALQLQKEIKEEGIFLKLQKNIEIWV